MGRATQTARQVRWYFGKLSWYSATLMGDNHYRRYLEHHRRTRPGEPEPTEREYWRMRHAAVDADPAPRCC